MHLTILGIDRPMKRAALLRVLGEHVADVQATQFRERPGRTWVALPLETRFAIVEKFAEALGELVVIEVEMASGGNGEDVWATRYRFPPRRDEEDRTGDARDCLDIGGEFEPADADEETIYELGWELVDPDEEPVREERSANLEDRWAKALVEHLVASGGIELRGKLNPTGEIAFHLQHPDEEDFAEAMLDLLVDSTAIAEVFVDEETLAAALRKTRPRR